MRKRLIPSIASIASLPDESCLDLDRVVSVEVTSEEKEYGIEYALVSGETRGLACEYTGKSNDPANL